MKNVFILSYVRLDYCLKSRNRYHLFYKDVKLDAGYRIDLLVERKVVVEIKSIESFTDVHIAQVLTYLKLSGCKIGLLLNFNVASLKHGIKRLAN